MIVSNLLCSSTKYAAFLGNTEASQLVACQWASYPPSPELTFYTGSAIMLQVLIHGISTAPLLGNEYSCKAHSAVFFLPNEYYKLALRFRIQLHVE